MNGWLVTWRRAFLEIVKRLPVESAIFAIFEQNDERSVIGTMGYEEAELGYWLAEPSWRKGLAKEGVEAVVDHAFRVSLLNRLNARCMLGNEPSRRVLVGLGFRPTHIGA